MITVTQRRRRGAQRRPCSGPLTLHIFSFRFIDSAHPRFTTVLIRGRMHQNEATGIANAEAAKAAREPWCINMRSVPAPRAMPALDALCDRHTAFPTMLALLTAAAGYRPSIRLDLTGQDGLRLARAYDRMQGLWGDHRRAFVTGALVRRPRRGGLI